MKNIFLILIVLFSFKANSQCTASVIDIAPVLCYGVSNGSATIEALNGVAPYSYTLYHLGNPSPIITQSSQVFSNLNSGDYTVVVTDGGLCSESVNFTITEPNPISFNLQVTNATAGNCNGEIDISATGGTSPYEYSINGGLFFSNSNFIGLCASSYDVSVRDENGCTTFFSTIIESTDIVFEATLTNNLCSYDSTGVIDVNVLSGDGPFTYSWSNGSTDEDLNNLGEGQYILSITDGNNYTVDSTFTITNITSIDTAVTNLNNTLSANQNSAQYQWIDCDQNQNITNETNQAFQVTNNGEYQVEITLNGCVDTSDCIMISGLDLESQSGTLNLFSSYPNPTTDKITLTLSTDLTVKSISIVDFQGKMVLEAEVLKSQKIDCSEFEKGIYTIKIITESTILTKKIVVN